MNQKSTEPIKGAYVHTNGPMSEYDKELIREFVENCRLEWEKEDKKRAVPKKDDPEG